MQESVRSIDRSGFTPRSDNGLASSPHAKPTVIPKRPQVAESRTPALGAGSGDCLGSSVSGLERSRDGTLPPPPFYLLPEARLLAAAPLLQSAMRADRYPSSEQTVTLAQSTSRDRGLMPSRRAED